MLFLRARARWCRGCSPSSRVDASIIFFALLVAAGPAGVSFPITTAQGDVVDIIAAGADAKAARELASQLTADLELEDLSREKRLDPAMRFEARIEVLNEQITVHLRWPARTHSYSAPAERARDVAH